MSSSQTLQFPPQENACPECGNQLSFDEKRAETTCSSCGLVIKETQLDRGAEWTAYDQDETNERSRVGAPNTELRHDHGIGFTEIGKYRDGAGNTLGLKKRRKLSRLRLHHRRSQAKTTREKNLRLGIAEILRMGSALDLNDNIKETATVIFRRATQNNLLPGRSVEAIASGALYASIRLAGLPLQIPKVAQVSRVEKQRIKHGYNLLNNELNLSTSPRSPEDFLPKIFSELNDPNMEQTNGRVSYADESDLELKSRELIDIARENQLLSGKRPSGIAGGAIYAAEKLLSKDTDAWDGVTLNQHAIGEITDNSPVTIRVRSEELIDAYHENEQ